MSARPKAITIIAWLMIAIGAIGIVANGYNYLVGAARYSPPLWLTFVALKAAGLIAGVLLLQMRRAGVWLFAVSFAASVLIAVSATGPYTLTQWLGAALVAAVFAGGFWLVVREHWEKLRPMRGFGHA